MNDFFKTIDQTVEWVSDFIYEGCETIFQGLEESVMEVEVALDVTLEPLLGWLSEIDDVISTTSRPFVQMVTPALQEHPACVGCGHYHGETYGAQLLVCAMHPYGVEEKSCPDWESVWEGGPH